MVKARFLVLIIAALGTGAFFVLKSTPRAVSIKPEEKTTQAAENLSPISEAPLPPNTTSTTPKVGGPYSDIGPQNPLPNLPSVVKALYLTAWSAGSSKKVDQIIGLLHNSGFNAVVIDIKDYSGYVSYAMDVPEVKASGAESEIRIASPNALIKKLHDNGIYAIARLTVFQDPILAKAYPEWALKDKTTGATWTDNKGLAWMDPAGHGAWDYNISIAKDALSRGFDEINFDYVRFASDGSLGNISYPFWDEKILRHKIIAQFFSYLRQQLGSARLSADLFGLSTVNRDDLGIGQTIEDAYRYFDYVSPMVYPSHYASGFIGYKNPANYPYEVIKYSLDHALARLEAMNNPPPANSSSTPRQNSGQATSTTEVPAPTAIEPARGKLRPWIQDFDLGAVYNAAMVHKEFQAVKDSLDSTSTHSTSSGQATPGQFTGWLVWNPSNNYVETKFTGN